MFRKKILISILIFSVLMILTSIIKTQTRIVEKKILILEKKILKVKNEIYESQIDFHYLSSPENLTKKIKIYSLKDYTPTKFSNIFLSIEDYYEQRSKLSKIKINEKKNKEE
tara:strand:- start:281 stop:616 length:336 start_codon:yes stop_codon:yes gene_type:complete